MVSFTWLVLAAMSIATLSLAHHAPPLQAGSPGHNKRAASDAILPPTEDPWYTAPQGYEKEPPGTVLRIREAPGNLASTATNCSAAYNVLYRTTDSLYKPSWAVTTFFIPSNPVQALLSFQIPYDSACLDAGPSYAMHVKVPLEVNTSLSRGWYVTVPDYEGPLASFTAGVMSGHATLDSVRAVLSAGCKHGLSKKAAYALWGYSGGALASEWAAELQVQYAPEMNFSGAALGGLTPNTTNVLLTINKGYAAGVAPSGFLGETAQFPDARANIVAQLKTSGPYNATTFLSVLNMTAAQASATFAFQDISLYFVDGFAGVFNSITEKVTNRDGLMGYHGVPQMPIYAYKAIADLESPIADTDTLIERYCSVGVNILYERNTVGGHAADNVNGRPAAQAWLDSVLGGAYASQYPTFGCTIRNVTVNITSSPT